MIDLEKIRERWARVTPIALARALHQIARDAILLARENEEVHGVDRERAGRYAALDTIHMEALPECLLSIDPTDIAALIEEVERLRAERAALGVLAATGLHLSDQEGPSITVANIAPERVEAVRDAFSRLPDRLRAEIGKAADHE